MSDSKNTSAFIEIMTFEMYCVVKKIKKGGFMQFSNHKKNVMNYSHPNKYFIFKLHLKKNDTWQKTFVNVFCQEK